MILSDVDIKKSLASKYIRITPKPDLQTQLSSCSIDFRLGNTFSIFENSKFALLDPHDKNLKIPSRIITVKKGDRFIMHPNSYFKRE